MSHRYLSIVIVASLWLANSLTALGEQGTTSDSVSSLQAITNHGQKLASFLDSMDVERHWLRSHKHIAWRSGEPLIRISGQTLPNYHKDETHCSAFVAAACERNSIYILRPPAHSHNLLANAQLEWLASESGHESGWSPIRDAVVAQATANRGDLVVAVFKNPDATAPGHIAIVRPSEKAEELVRHEGPQIIQAGFTNSNSTSLMIGFSHHLGAWTSGKDAEDAKYAVKFFCHELTLD